LINHGIPASQSPLKLRYGFTCMAREMLPELDCARAPLLYDSYMRLTLDTNCLSDLENGTDQAESIRELIRLHRAGKIQVFVSAIAASEHVTGKGLPEQVGQFEGRLKKLAIDDLPSVLPTGRSGMSFGVPPLTVTRRKRYRRCQAG